MCKALSEAVIIEKSLFVKAVKFVNIRYGNVLNSRGSIIPLLHELGKDSKKSEFILTHNQMTRFVMTLEQSVSLIEHAIEHAESGDIVLYGLVSMYLKDLFEIFSELYKKPVVLGSVRPGEKLHESLISETQSHRLLQGDDGFYYIKPNYKKIYSDIKIMNYTSMMNPMSKDTLKSYLKERGLLNQ
jgi:UDP-glucose 4-epimerase